MTVTFLRFVELSDQLDSPESKVKEDKWGLRKRSVLKGMGYIHVKMSYRQFEAKEEFALETLIWKLLAHRSCMTHSGRSLLDKRPRK